MQIAGLLVLALVMASLIYLAWERQQPAAGVARTPAVEGLHGEAPAATVVAVGPQESRWQPLAPGAAGV